MHRLLLAFAALIAFAPPAQAGERNFIVTAFDRIRVDGPFEVRVTVSNQSGNGAHASGDDKALAGLELSVQGTTLVVRKDNNGWGTTSGASGNGNVVVYVSAETLRGAGVVGGGKLIVTGKLQTQRLDFTVTGAGSMDVQGIAADDVIATLIGTGSIALAGRSGHARLLTNGNGTIAATALDVGDLVVRLDGPGQTQASARYNADLVTTGLGAITVAGRPRCRAVAPAGGPITCEGVRGQ